MWDWRNLETFSSSFHPQTQKVLQVTFGDFFFSFQLVHLLWKHWVHTFSSQTKDINGTCRYPAISSVSLKFELEKIQKTELKAELPALCGHWEWSQGVYAGRGPGLRLHAYYFGVRQSLGVQEIHCQGLLRKRLDAKAVSETSTYPMDKSIRNVSLCDSLCWNTNSQSREETALLKAQRGSVHTHLPPNLCGRQY